MVEGSPTRPAPKADSALVGELRDSPEYTLVLNVDTGEKGDSHVRISTDLRDRILAALSDRDVVLEEAAKAAEDERYAQNVVDACYSEGNRLPETYNDACDDIARAIRAIKGGVDE